MGEVLRKIFSARFITTMMLTTTYCLSMLACLYFTAAKVMSVDVFLALFAGFSGLATMVLKSYFERTDRQTKKEEGNA